MDVTSYLLGKNAGGGVTPTGTINITENGTTNVTNYATANVNVQPNLETLTETITENGTTTYTPSQNKDGFSSVSITTNVSGGSDLDWSAIGYSSRPQSINDDYDYAKNIYDNWDATQTSCYQMFKNDKKIRIMPFVDTSNVNLMNEMFSGATSLAEIPQLNLREVTNMAQMFYDCSDLMKIPSFNTSNVNSMQKTFMGCTSLEDVPVLNTSNLSGSSAFQLTFSHCPNLTNTSLDNILQMCINATSYTSANYKTLARLGFVVNDYPASRIQALPHYQDFINAGWTIGY